MTCLNRWYNRSEEGYTRPIYTHDTWEIPEEGTEIWCTAWKRGQTIKPYGDGCHVVVGLSVYHCDELMEILQRQEEEGFTWGIEGVTMKRCQQRYSKWEEVTY